MWVADHHSVAFIACDPSDIIGRIHEAADHQHQQLPGIAMKEMNCADCSSTLAANSQGQPCPNCGSTIRKHSVKIDGALALRGHLTVIGLRDSEALAFSESEGAEFTRYASLEPDGTVLLNLKGLPPRNEQDSETVCDIFTSAMVRDGIQAKLLGRGQDDEDCVLSVHGERIGAQVVRALSDREFWQALDWQGEIGTVRMSVSTATMALRTAIEHKTTIPPRQRGKLILLLDAYRVPAVSLAIVAKEFVRHYGHWAEQLGFRAIYVVGPSPTFLQRLAG